MEVLVIFNGTLSEEQTNLHPCKLPKVNVYCIYFENGKRYVGVESRTGQRIKSHQKQHALRNRNIPLVTRAIQKHGWDTCKWRYLITNATNEQGYALEKFFIKHFQTQDPTKGYNVSAGGDGGSGMAGIPLKEETKRKLSEALKGRKPSEETRAKYRASAAKVRPWLRNRPNWRRMPVVCMETGDIYDSFTHAAKAVGLAGPAHVASCCNGKREIAAGYHWSPLIKI